MAINDQRGQDNPPLDDSISGEVKEMVKGFAVGMDEHGALYNRLFWRGLLALALVLNLIGGSIVLWSVIVPSYFRDDVCTALITPANNERSIVD